MKNISITLFSILVIALSCTKKEETRFNSILGTYYGPFIQVNSGYDIIYDSIGNILEFNPVIDTISIQDTVVIEGNFTDFTFVVKGLGTVDTTYINWRKTFKWVGDNNYTISDGLSGYSGMTRELFFNDPGGTLRIMGNGYSYNYGYPDTSWRSSFGRGKGIIYSNRIKGVM